MNDTNGKIGNALKAIGVGLILSFLTAVTTWLFVHTAKISSMEERQRSIDGRLSSLESGRTTPMAAETRAEFNAIWREMGKTREVK